jgi:hypothetical protein
MLYLVQINVVPTHLIDVLTRRDFVVSSAVEELLGVLPVTVEQLDQAHLPSVDLGVASTKNLNNNKKNIEVIFELPLSKRYLSESTFSHWSSNLKPLTFATLFTILSRSSSLMPNADTYSSPYIQSCLARSNPFLTTISYIITKDGILKNIII